MYVKKDLKHKFWVRKRKIAGQNLFFCSFFPLTLCLLGFLASCWLVLRLQHSQVSFFEYLTEKWQDGAFALQGDTPMHTMFSKQYNFHISIDFMVKPKCNKYPWKTWKQKPFRKNGSECVINTKERGVSYLWVTATFIPPNSPSKKQNLHDKKVSNKSINIMTSERGYKMILSDE